MPQGASGSTLANVPAQTLEQAGKLTQYKVDPTNLSADTQRSVSPSPALGTARDDSVLTVSAGHILNFCICFLSEGGGPGTCKVTRCTTMAPHGSPVWAQSSGVAGILSCSSLPSPSSLPLCVWRRPHLCLQTGSGYEVQQAFLKERRGWPRHYIWR